MRIWVDTDTIQRNKARGRNDPPIFVQVGGEVKKAHAVKIGEYVELRFERGPGQCKCGKVVIHVDESGVDVLCQ